MIISEFKENHSFLSNFYPCTITYQGIIFPTVEHAYQAAKSNKKEVMEHIANIDTPGKAKRYGNTIEIIPNWEEIKVQIMYELLLDKFFFGTKDLKDKIRSTGSTMLIEGNYWHDNFWGKCNCIKHKGEGANILGVLLMAVRKMCFLIV